MNSSVQPKEQALSGQAAFGDSDEPRVIQFQHGLDGYAGVVDTYLHESSPDTGRATSKSLVVDSVDKRGEVHTLLRFEHIFGIDSGQIPLGATILSATLELNTTSKGDGARLHRMVMPWSDGDTWNSLGNGIQADGQEAALQYDLITGFVPMGTTRLDVTASLQAWADGQPNYGWAFLPLGPDGWKFASAEGDAPPKLIVEYHFDGGQPPENRPPVANDDTATTPSGVAVDIDVLANDCDPDGDPLTIASFTQPDNGSVSHSPHGTLTYLPSPGFVGDDIFTYSAWDGALASEPATVHVSVSANEPSQPIAASAHFQHGVEGYAGVVDTYLHQSSPDTSRSTSKTLVVDGVDRKGEVQTLLRFEHIFGSEAGQIPIGATILSATLELNTTSKGDGARLHRMVLPWNDSDTWNSLGNGIQADGQEASQQYDLTTGFVPVGTTRLDVTASLQAWADGQPNYGWAFLPLGPDGWKFASAEGDAPPKLIVEYHFDRGEPPENRPPVAHEDTATTSSGVAVEIDVLANDSDPDGDPLSVASFTQPTHGTVTLNPTGTMTYLPNAGFIGSDSFTYSASDGSLQSATATVIVSVTHNVPPPLPLETSYIATAFGTSDLRNFEHSNANKSFFHDGKWWAVLPEQSGWHVYRFDGALPEPGTQGGWSSASPTLLTSGRRADIAWHGASDTLYVLNFGPSETRPRLYEMSYDEQQQTFAIDKNVQLAGSGGKLAGAEWERNTEMALGLDQNGIPVVAVIGPSASGGSPGLKLAYPTSSSLATWATLTIDSGPSTTSGSNGDNKADFVAFTLNGIDHVGFVYGDDASGLWKFAYQATPATPDGYATGWLIETITDAVVLDNHLAVLWDGSSIIMTVKDDKNAIWAIKGLPGEWEAPVLVNSASNNGSRPTLVYDESNEQIYVFYQENTNRPYGDIHFKVSSTAELNFDVSSPGTKIMTSSRDGENMSDPQTPVHAVGASTDGMFFLFARNQEAREIWYNDFLLDDDTFIA